VAYEFNGALTVRELLDSSTLFYAALRFLRARNPENVTPDAPSEDDAMRALLINRSVPVG